MAANDRLVSNGEGPPSATPFADPEPKKGNPMTTTNDQWDWRTSNVSRQSVYQPAPVQPARPKRKVFRWFFLAIQVLFIVWIIGGLASTSSSHQNKACNADQYVDACKAGYSVGRGLGIAMVIGLWVAVDVIVGVTYAVWRHFSK
jgi:hypothetical protein